MAATEIQLWMEIQNVLNISPKPLDVLQIRRKLLDVYGKQQITNILYGKHKQGLLQKWDKPPNFKGNKKPLWSLTRQMQYYDTNNDQTNYNTNPNQYVHVSPPRHYNNPAPIYHHHGPVSHRPEHAPDTMHSFAQDIHNNTHNQPPPLERGRGRTRARGRWVGNQQMIQQQHQQINQQPHHSIHQQRRPRGRGRGRDRGRFTNINPIITEHKENKENIDIDDVLYTSNLISTPFEKLRLKESEYVLKEYCAKDSDEEYYRSYLYHIQITDDPNQCPIGLMLPRKIPHYALQNIMFPIQIIKDQEQQCKEEVNRFIEADEKESNHPLRFQKQDTIVSLKLIKQNTEEIEHKMNIKAFDDVQRANIFIWNKLNQAVTKSDNHFEGCDSNNTQRRYYFIVPLKYMNVHDEDDGKYEEENMELEVDYDAIKRICLGSLCALNGKRWMNRIVGSKLKNELVEIKNSSRKHSTLCMSYGIHRQKYQEIRDRKDDIKEDLQSIQSDLISVKSFSNESVAQRYIAMKAGGYKKKLKNKESSKHVILTMQQNTDIENVLIVEQSKKCISQIQSAMSHEYLTDAYPCGIRSNLWYALRTIPSILYHIEKWFNIIDFQQQILHKMNGQQFVNEYKDVDEMISDPVYIDLTLLYNALHRSTLSTNGSYQIYNVLGSYILKFIATLFKFSSDPTIRIDDLHDFVKSITNKTSITNTLYRVGKTLNIECFAILHDYAWNIWNPPQFQNRKQNSLYNINTKYNLRKGDGNNKYLCSFLLQSVIGVIWSSIMNQHNGNAITHAINGVMEFCIQMDILPHKYHISAHILQLKQHMDIKEHDLETIYKMKQAICDKMEMNILFKIALECVITDCKKYKQSGLTFDRLEVLGDAVLDLLILWYIYCNIGNNKFNQEIGKKHERVQWKKYITDIRHLLVNDNYLGYLFAMNGLHHFMLFYNYDNNKKQKKFIQDYIRKMEQHQEAEGNNNGEGFYESMKTIKSPGGFQENVGNASKWPLEITAPDILGRSFEALLGAIFLGSNHNIFSNSSSFELKVWDLSYCIAYLSKFMKDTGVWNNKFNWDEWIGNSVNSDQRIDLDTILKSTFL